MIETREKAIERLVSRAYPSLAIHLKEEALRLFPDIDEVAPGKFDKVKWQREYMRKRRSKEKNDAPM